MDKDRPDDDKTQSFVTLSEGTMVSHYRIADKIGAGGMGEVYLAEDTKLKRHVALKFLPAHTASNDDMRSRFTREARAVAALSHPNIVTIHEVGEWGGRPFFAMEHVRGETLRAVIKQGKLSTNDAVRLAMQVCEGLHEAHEAGVVHRDIKPGNIIIDTKRRARILDFGLAMVSGEDKLTKTGSTLGTVGYMSPEQVSGKQVDHRSDLFSVGVILYEMLTGRRPFEGDNDAAIVRAITSSDPEPVARFKSGVTGQLQQILDKALSKDPSLRYQHADGMLSDLRRLEVDSTSPKKSKLGLWATIFVLAALVGYFAVDRFMIPEESPEGWTNSVAVLIFRNLSTDPEHELFCEGMTEEIIGRLSTIKPLKVTSTQSMLRFKDTNLDLKEIGKQLKVANILEGNIQIVGDNIRVRAQLIRVEDDAHIWTDRYDGEITSIFDIQDEISRSIADVLEATLVGGAESFVSRRGTDDIEAYNAYVRGRHFWRKRTQEGLTTAIGHFENAVAIDPNYAAGWSGLADGWHMLANYEYVDHLTGNAKADTASLMALELDPNLAEAQTSRGLVLRGQTMYHEAEKHFLKAIELNPGYPWAHIWYGSVLKALGRNEESAEQDQLAYELDPLSPAVIHTLARESRIAGNTEEAEEYLKAIQELEPSSGPAFQELTALYFDAGDTVRALEIADRMIQRIPDNWQSYNNKAWRLLQLGRLDEAQAMYLKSIEMAPDLWAPYFYYAFFFIDGRYDIEEAIRWLEKAVELDSLQARVRSNYAHFLRVAGRMDESIEQCKKVMELAPYDPDSYRAYGWAIGNGLHRYEEAIEYMERALEMNPRHENSHTSISLMYANIGRFDEALAAINRAIELGSLWPDQRIQRKAEIFAMAGMFDSAAVWFRKHYEIRPHNRRTIMMLGNLNTHLRRYDVADSIYGVMASVPDSFWRGWGRGYTIKPLLHQGRFAEALARLEEGIEIDRAELGNTASPLRNKHFHAFRLCHLYLNDPQRAYEEMESNDQSYQASGAKNDFNTAWVASFKAIALAATGEVDRARKIVEELLSATGDNAENYLETYYLSMAEINHSGSDFESAVNWMKKAYEINESYNNSLYLGVALVSAGRFAEAVDILEIAISIYDGGRYGNPDESVIGHYYLGQAYEGDGRTDDAIEQYEIFLDIWKNADEGLESVEDAKARLARLKSD